MGIHIVYHFSLLSSSVFLVFDMADLQEGEKPLEQPVASLPQHLRLFEVGTSGRSLQGKPWTRNAMGQERPVISTFLPYTSRHQEKIGMSHIHPLLHHSLPFPPENSN